MPNSEEKQARICDYEGSTYQSSFWDAGGRDYEDQVEAVALSALLPKNGEFMLEVGAGAGRNTTRYRGFEKIVLLDYSITQLRQAQGKLGRSDSYIYVASDANSMPFVQGTFDTVTMIRVLHHIPDGPGVLNEVRRVLVPAGWFILEYANKLNIKALGRYFLGKQRWNPFDPEPIEFVELNFNFHPTTIKTWLEGAGFDVVAQRTVSHFRVPILKRIVPTRVLVAADSLVQPTGKFIRISPSVFTKNKAVGDSPTAQPGMFFRCLICDNSEFEETAEMLVCGHCGTRWAIEDGIYNFRSPLSPL